MKDEWIEMSKGKLHLVQVEVDQVQKELQDRVKNVLVGELIELADAAKLFGKDGHPPLNAKVFNEELTYQVNANLKKGILKTGRHAVDTLVRYFYKPKTTVGC